jgi:hypothetical protein
VTIATVVSARLATVHELATVYGGRDLWWMIEVNAIDTHNKIVIQADADKNQ